MSLPHAFWDSSALVPLCLTQSATEKAEAWAQQFNMAVWWGASVEVHSAIARIHRSGELTDEEKSDAEACLQALADRWREVLPSDSIREEAKAALDTYPLRAADSLQLAAALIWCRNRPTGRTFLCADTRLAEAAATAGFTVLRP